jgi:cupin 2 domain-containing protein
MKHPDGNFEVHLPDSLPEELTETLITAKNVRIERIISTGQSSPPDFWYGQDENEWLVLFQGEAELEIAESENEISVLPLFVGDYVFIPAHQKHRVKSTSNNMATVWLAVFFYRRA